MRKGIIIVSIVFVLSSCSKSMDIQRDDRVEDAESVYTRLSRSYEHLRATFFGPVESGVSHGFTSGGYMLAGYCDEAQEVYQASPVHSWYKGAVSSSYMPLWGDGSGTDRWNTIFRSIRGANEAIMYLCREDLVRDFNDSERKSMLGQFYAIRAFSYLQLVKRFGPVPLLARPQKKGEIYSKDRRPSFARCADFIIASCDSALISDPEIPWFTSSFPFHNPALSRSALEAIKSEVALFAASPLWADNHEGTEKYTWTRSAQIAKRALDLALGHGAALADATTVFPNTSDSGINAYEKYFLSSYPFSLSWDRETLYQPYNYGYKQSMGWKWAGLPLDEGQVSAGACPTQEMVDAYEVISEDGGKAVPLLNLKEPYSKDGKPNFNPEALALGYVDCSEKMYENRDPRFYATIYYDNCELELRDGRKLIISTEADGNCGLNLSPLNRRNTCTGYYLRKFNNINSGAASGNMDGFQRQLRLALLYLNFAEAAALAYGEDFSVPALTVVETDEEGNEKPVVYGKPMTAREAVNLVRARAGMPGIDDSGEDFILRLKNERRVELAFEEHRFFDVRRWASPEGDLRETDSRVSGMRIEEKSGVKTFTRYNFERKCYGNKFLLYPIHIDEIRKILSVTGEDWQNRGWK